MLTSLGFALQANKINERRHTAAMKGGVAPLYGTALDQGRGHGARRGERSRASWLAWWAGW